MKKGFTLIELLAVIVILAIIALISSPIIIGLIDDARKEAFKSSSYGIVKAGELLYSKDLLNRTNEEVTFTYTDGVESSSVGGKELKYKGTKPQSGQIKVNIEGQVAIAIHNGSYCAEKGYNDNEVTLSEKTEEECKIEIEIINYSYYSDTKGVNIPALAKGMTPVKWDGANWIETESDDSEWYDYTTTSKKWANAKTEDGSMWVWIPRYAYRISTNYHTSSAGTILIKFLKNTSLTASDDSVVELEPNYSGSSQNNFIKHPAFKFGDAEQAGIWVAKFEVSGTVSALDFVPGVQSLRSITIGDMFNASRNMETNNRYGWNVASSLNADGTFTTDNNDLDVHMTKNIERGAAVYLAHSAFGKNLQITSNDNTSYYTGGNVGNAYTTNISQSTTGNIYGIYDLAGGSAEYTSSYVNNGNANLSGNGSSIMSADSKYKDIYSISGGGTGLENYNSSVSNYGDAVYETSVNNDGPSSWYGLYINMPNGNGPWFAMDGGHAYGNGSWTGSFYFYSGNGASNDGISWRVTVIVDSEF